MQSNPPIVCGERFVTLLYGDISNQLRVYSCPSKDQPCHVSSASPAAVENYRCPGHFTMIHGSIAAVPSSSTARSVQGAIELL